MLNQTPPELERKILEMTAQFPTYSYLRLSQQLRFIGVGWSCATSGCCGWSARWPSAAGRGAGAQRRGVRVLRRAGDERQRGEGPGRRNAEEIALELLDTVRKNTTIDWAVKESMRAKMRAMVKRVLRKHGYPPDKQEKTTRTVLEQAEALSEEWAAPQ